MRCLPLVANFSQNEKRSYHPADSRNEDTANTPSLSWSHWVEWPNLQPTPAPTACPPVDHSQTQDNVEQQQQQRFQREKKKMSAHLCNVDSRQRLSISLGQVQFILLDIELFNLVWCIHWNNILHKCEKAEKKKLIEESPTLFCLNKTLLVSIHVAILPLSGQKWDNCLMWFWH